MSIQNAIQGKLTRAFEPGFLEVVNESHMHNVPPNSESHFKVTIVSDRFDGLRSVKRHQEVYAVLSDELKGGVHALALHTYTAAEWQGRAPESPQCLGGSKTDSNP
jgi:BolA family transcriptional regulator, general stress-responsive regulator